MQRMKKSRYQRFHKKTMQSIADHYGIALKRALKKPRIPRKLKKQLVINQSATVSPLPR